MSSYDKIMMVWLLFLAAFLIIFILINGTTDGDNKIMKEITEFKAAVDASFKKINAAVDGLTTDVKTLNDKITELQNSPGILNPDDQNTLNEIAAAAGAIADRVAALDEATEPPTPPAASPTPENPA